MSKLSATLVLAQEARPKPQISVKTCLLIGMRGKFGSALLQAISSHSSTLGLQLAVDSPMQSFAAGIQTVMLAQARCSHALVLVDDSVILAARERTIAQCGLADLPQLATQLISRGLRCLVVLRTHSEMELPDSVASGLLDEAELALAQLPLQRLLIVRAAQLGHAPSGLSLGQRYYWFVREVFRSMVAPAQQALRTDVVAAFCAEQLSADELGGEASVRVFTNADFARG